jgi:hypothetical protein
VCPSVPDRAATAENSDKIEEVSKRLFALFGMDATSQERERCSKRCSAVG